MDSFEAHTDTGTTLVQLFHESPEEVMRLKGPFKENEARLTEGAIITLSNSYNSCRADLETLFRDGRYDEALDRIDVFHERVKGVSALVSPPSPNGLVTTGEAGRLVNWITGVKMGFDLLSGTVKG